MPEGTPLAYALFAHCFTCGKDVLAAKRIAVALAAKGIHDPSEMPFGFPWTDTPSPEFERNCLKHFWRTRAEWRPTSWSASFAIVCDGEIVGARPERRPRS